MPLTLTICGARGSIPRSGAEYVRFGGDTSCYVLQSGSHAVVVDCGTGFLSAGPLLRNVETVDILLTHYHYDHVLGLLYYDQVIPEGAKVCFYVPGDPASLTRLISMLAQPPLWPVQPDISKAQIVNAEGSHALAGGRTLTACPACHPGGGLLYRVGAPEGDVCFLFDHEHGGTSLTGFTAGAKVLLYDAMFTDACYADCLGWGHSTWQEGVRLAMDCGKPQLILTHHSPDWDDAALLKLEAQAQSVYPQASYARQMEVILVG